MVRKTARSVSHASTLHYEEWMDSSCKSGCEVVKGHRNRVASSLKKIDPSNFIFSHTTIVASVDVHRPKKIKLGRRFASGCELNVVYPDIRINNSCDKLINNNMDAWERDLLLNSYRSFIGAHNYCEHVQIPELSKGFIADAVARDTGDSVYIDILVATNKKHDVLVDDILSGRMNALSMGCTSQFTICTKCGNVAPDEDSLCCCIVNDGKGSKFFDDDGSVHRVAELVGHKSVPNSCQFIEASWVHVPAFAGAVKRNVISFDPNVSVASSNKIYSVSDHDDVVSDFEKSAGLKVASIEKTAEDDPFASLFGGDKEKPDGGGDDSGDDEAEDKKSDEESGEDKKDDDKSPDQKFDDLVSKAQEQLMEGIVKSISDRFSPKPKDVGTTSISTNDNLVVSSYNAALNNRFASVGLVKFASSTYKKLKKGVKIANSDAIKFMWINDKLFGIEKHSSVYKEAIRIATVYDNGNKKSVNKLAAFYGANKFKGIVLK